MITKSHPMPVAAVGMLPGQITPTCEYWGDSTSLSSRDTWQGQGVARRPDSLGTA